MECAACLGTCGGACPVCDGMCGAGKPKEEEKDGGCGSCGGGFDVPLKPGMSLPEVILAHFNAGHNLEDMKVAETPKGLVTFALGWKPKPAERARVNKEFQTFNFLANGNMKAQRGRMFARDADVLIGMLKDYEVEGKGLGLPRAQIAAANATAHTHRTNVLKRFHLEDKGYSLPELAKISGYPLKTLQEVYNRGVGAYKTNPQSVRMKGTFKKGVNAPMSQKLSKEQWALSRVYSFIDGNPKHDTDLRRQD